VTLTFDPATHTYRLNNSPVPSVTQILRAVFPTMYAGIRDAAYAMQKGQAVHAAAALIARDDLGTYDPQIEGQVQACRKWFADTQAIPLEIETAVGHELYRYAGTVDLVAKIGGKLVIVDWKATVTPHCQWQLGAYEAAGGFGCKRGFAVQLNEDGTYNTGGPWDMVKAGREFAIIRSEYGMREREGLIQKREDGQHE
jgi:hypothetical protein